MMLCLIQNGLLGIKTESTEEYKTSIVNFQERVKDLRFGYVPGIIRHFYHGSKKNRKYSDRWKILVDHQYDPTIFITYDENGIIIPVPSVFPDKLKDDIYDYFAERNEDEGVNPDGKYDNSCRDIQPLT
jgi:hypothetical protein